MLRSATSYLRAWTRRSSTRASSANTTTTVLRRHESWFLRLGVPVIFFQGVGATYACATQPLGRSGRDSSTGKRIFYSVSAVGLSTAALLVCRSLTHGRVMALRIVGGRQNAHILSRRWYDPTGALFIAAAPTVAPRARSRLRMSFAQLERAAQDRVAARAGQKSGGRKGAGLIAIRVYESVAGRGERIETFTVDARECDVFDIAALRGIAINDDVDERGRPLDAALR